MSPRRLLPLVCLCVLVAPASSGAAAKRLDAKGDSPSFPVIAGASIVYGAGSSDEGVEIRILNGQGDTAIRSRPPAPEDDNETVGWFRSLSFKASTGVLVADESDSYSIKGAEQVSRSAYDYGPLTGPWQKLTPCGGLGATEPDGNRLALTTCSGATPNLEVRDVIAGTTLRVIEKARLIGVEGDLVAYSQDGQVVVRNYVTDAELYRVESAQLTGDLQADGKLVLVTPAAAPPGSGCYTLAWYSQAEPTAHPVAAPCASFDVRFVADRLAYTARDASGAPERLVISDLAGQTRTVAGATSGFDLDGTRIVYACGGGRVEALVSDDLADPLNPDFCASLAPPPGRGCHPDFGQATDGIVASCPVAISGSRAKVDSRGRLTLRVKCSSGCEGSVRVRRKVGRRWKWITKSVKLNIGREGVRRYRVRLTSGRPPAGDGWKVQVVSKSLNAVSGSRSYVRTLRLVRG